jgi:type II secretory pathway component PulK
MKINLRHETDGMAIFIVLLCIGVLAFMAGTSAYNMRVETKLAANSNNETEMEWLGRSGVELARYTLAQELVNPGPAQHYDALNQIWAGGVGETNEPCIPLTGVQLGHGIINVKITDMERKFNINTAVNNEPLMTQALVLAGVDS